MQWEGTERGGFTGGSPWLEVNPITERINAAAQLGDPDSVFAHYRALIRLRKTRPVLALGDFTPVDRDHPRVLAYQRRWEGERLLCVSNFFRTPCLWRCPVPLEGLETALSNYPDSRPAEEWALRPYESVLLLGRE